jgi:hypothetical protein
MNPSYNLIAGKDMPVQKYSQKDKDDLKPAMFLDTRKQSPNSFKVFLRSYFLLDFRGYLPNILDFKPSFKKVSFSNKS